MKKKYGDLPVVLEQDTEFQKGKHFDDIVSKDIIELGMNENDPLCMKVIEKFTEIYGTEVGNAALTHLPSGGIYLVGGVTNGIMDYLTSTPTFMNAYSSKGRLSETIKNFRIMVVKPNIEVGLLGAQEAARRQMMKAKVAKKPE